MLSQRGERVGQTIELVVDLNPHRLEKPGEIRRSRPRSEGAANGPDEVVADGEGTVGSAPDDFPSEARGASLVAVFPKYSQELELGRLVEPVGGAERCVHTHAHVERCAF